MLVARKRLSSFSSEHPCIFVLSTGRVGTETLSALLNLSPNILSLHEPHPLLYKLAKNAYQNGMSGCESVWDDAVMSLRVDLFESALSSGVGYVETSPQATFLAPAINRMIPDVKFIHLTRHPATVIRSGMRRAWYAGHPADATRITPLAASETCENWPGMTPLAKIAWLWSETNRWICEYTSKLPEEKHIFLKAEDIFNGDINVIKKLYEFCSSEYPDEKKINQILSKNYNKSTAGDFPPFGKWSSADVDELKSYAGEMAANMKYNLEPTS
jgi:hypothetical protein